MSGPQVEQEKPRNPALSEIGPPENKTPKHADGTGFLSVTGLGP